VNFEPLAPDSGDRAGKKEQHKRETLLERFKLPFSIDTTW